jgi:hypothetical protein
VSIVPGAADSVGRVPDGAVAVWWLFLPPEEGVDNPGTSCERRPVRVEEGLPLWSNAGAAGGSLRAEANQGLVAIAGGAGAEDTGCGVEAAGP